MSGPFYFLGRTFFFLWKSADLRPIPMPVSTPSPPHKETHTCKLTLTGVPAVWHGDQVGVSKQFVEQCEARALLSLHTHTHIYTLPPSSLLHTPPPPHLYSAPPRPIFPMSCPPPPPTFPMPYPPTSPLQNTEDRHTCCLAWWPGLCVPAVCWAAWSESFAVFSHTHISTLTPIYTAPPPSLPYTQRRTGIPAVWHGDEVGVCQQFVEQCGARALLSPHTHTIYTLPPLHSNPPTLSSALPHHTHTEGQAYLLFGMVTRSVCASSLLSSVERELCCPAISALHLHFSQQSQ